MEIATAAFKAFATGAGIAKEAAIQTYMTSESIAKGFALPAAIGGTTIDVAGQIQAAKGEKKATKYNAALALKEAEAIRRAGEHETEQEKEEARKLKSRQLVGLAKTGVIPTAGTPLSLLAETEYNIQKELRIIGSQYGISGGRARSEAELQRMFGRGKTRASRYQIGSTLLTGAYRTASLLS